MSFKRNSQEIIIIVSCVAVVVIFIILYLACKKRNRTQVRTRRYQQQELNLANNTIPVFILPQIINQDQIRMNTAPVNIPQHINDNQNFRPTEEYHKQPAYNPNFS